MGFWVFVAIVTILLEAVLIGFFVGLCRNVNNLTDNVYAIAKLLEEVNKKLDKK